jgi:hypothetical protein
MNSGFIYEIFLDQPNGSSKYLLAPGNGQTNWFNFYIPAAYAGDLSWRQHFEWLMRRSSAGYSLASWAEYGSHMVQAVVDKILNPPTRQLVTVPTTVRNNGGGSYTLTWTVPEGAIGYRIKYSPDKTIVDWVGFSPGSNTFIGDPNKTCSWFAAEDAPEVPSPPAAGRTQTYSFKGNPSKSYQFAVKAYVESSFVGFQRRGERPR